MKKNRLAALFTVIFIVTGILSRLLAQEANPLNGYRETLPNPTTWYAPKLDIHFDYKKRYLHGREWVTLTPHFYSTDTLRLDIQGDGYSQYFCSNKWQKTSTINFTYDSLSLNIKLDKVV